MSISVERRGGTTFHIFGDRLWDSIRQLNYWTFLVGDREHAGEVDLTTGAYKLHTIFIRMSVPNAIVPNPRNPGILHGTNIGLEYDKATNTVVSGRLNTLILDPDCKSVQDPITSE